MRDRLLGGCLFEINKYWFEFDYHPVGRLN
jgi:hypothetical protein